MRKALAMGAAALTFGGALATAALPGTAAAQYYGHGGYYGGHHHHNDAGVAVAAGIVGLALGAAIGSSYHGSYARPAYGYSGAYPASGYSYGAGYAPAYYGNGYGYAPAPATCVSRNWVWDPYLGQQVLVTTRYAC